MKMDDPTTLPLYQNSAQSYAEKKMIFWSDFAMSLFQTTTQQFVAELLSKTVYRA